MSSLKISCVAVDDEPMALNLVESYIEKTPFLELKTKCNSAIEAMQYIKEHPVDLLFLDIQMPGLNGFEVLKKIREKSSSNWCPVIIVSAKGELESIKKGYDLEADHYLTKPFDMSKLLKAIKMMLGLVALRKKDNE